MTVFDIIVLSVMWLFLPSIIFLSQMLWVWSFADIRDSEWFKRTWFIEMTNIDLNKEDNSSFSILVIAIPAINFFASLFVVLIGLLVYALFTKGSYITIFAVSFSVFLIMVPMLIRLARSQIRKKEKLMQKLGQEEPVK